MVALAIAPLSQVKAAGRLVEALASLGLDSVATVYAHGFTDRWPVLTSSLRAHLRGPPPAEDWERSATSTLWWEEQTIAGVLITHVEIASIEGQLSWDGIKADGNNLFRSGSFAPAAEAYSRALRRVEGVSSLVQLLCNRAAALMQLDRPDSALMDATASLILDPCNIKAWYRRASALHKLERNVEALAACTRAKQLLQAGGRDGEAFTRLASTIAEAQKSAATPRAPPSVSTAQQKALLDEMHERSGVIKKDVADAGQLAMFSSMLSLLPESAQTKMFGSKIAPMPPFHLELAKHRGWPKGVDAQWARGYLNHVFEQVRCPLLPLSACAGTHACFLTLILIVSQSRLLPYVMESVYSKEDFEFPQADILKRANGQPARLEWLMSGPKVGTICSAVGTTGYPQFLRQPFTNQAYRKELLSRGTVHVAVGFVDLGTLLACDLGAAPEGREPSPLRFVGVELSAFAIAKSLVIWQMISDAADGQGCALSVLQVWFSATWERRTEAAFRCTADPPPPRPRPPPPRPRLPTPPLPPPS